jgi:hypothetical protein
VAILFKGKHYQMTSGGFKNKFHDDNPLLIGFFKINARSMYAFGKWDIIINETSLNQKELTSFFEMPMNYYFGNQYIENKLKIYLKFYTLYGATGPAIVKVIPAKPLPPGFKFIYSNTPTSPSKYKIYHSLKFEYNGETPITFVKDFKEQVIDQSSILNGKMPFYISENNNCYTPAYENSIVVSRDSGKFFYNRFLNSEVEKHKRKYFKENEWKELIEYLKSQDLYEIYPLGHIFPGNGRVRSQCELSWNEIQFNFFGEPITFTNEGSLKVIKIPKDNVAMIEVISDKSKIKLHLIKRYFLNNNWTPKRDDLSKLAIVKKAKIKYPIYKYKEKDLHCGLTGNEPTSLYDPSLN